MEFFEKLGEMPVEELVAHIMLIIGVISLIIEKSKKLPFNPWSALFRWIGSKINEPINKRLDSIEKTNNERMDKLEEDNKQTIQLIQEIRTDYINSIAIIKEDYNTRIDKLEYDADEKETKRLRSNIICFADACRTDSKHYTKQHFENIFRDYDDYLSYCEVRNFKNHFIDGEMEYIKSVYADFAKSNSNRG